jgi:hypothetical protein
MGQGQRRPEMRSPRPVSSTGRVSDGPRTRLQSEETKRQPGALATCRTDPPGNCDLWDPRRSANWTKRRRAATRLRDDSIGTAVWPDSVPGAGRVAPNAAAGMTHFEGHRSMTRAWLPPSSGDHKKQRPANALPRLRVQSYGRERCLVLRGRTLTGTTPRRALSRLSSLTFSRTSRRLRIRCWVSAVQKTSSRRRARVIAV